MSSSQIPVAPPEIVATSKCMGLSSLTRVLQSEEQPLQLWPEITDNSFRRSCERFRMLYKGILENEEEVAVKGLQRYGSGDKEENAFELPRVVLDSGAPFHSDGLWKDINEEMEQTNLLRNFLSDEEQLWHGIPDSFSEEQGILENGEEVAMKRLQRYGFGDMEENALELPKLWLDSGAVFHSGVRSLWAKLSNFGCTHNSPRDVEFTVTASAKGGTEIKIGSNVIHVPKYSSVCHPLVQMVLFACKKFDDSCYCLKSISPKCIYDMAMRLSSSVWTTVCGIDWISASCKSDSPKMGTISEFDTMNNIGWKKEPSENQSHHSDPDSSRAEHGIKAVGRNAPAAWVVATGAPHHATGDRGLLSGFITEHNDQFIHAADGVPMKVLARGAMVSDAVVLPDVWFVPGLTANLVSVSQLTELHYSVGFDCGECCISAAGKVVGKAHLQEGGLYVLDFLKVPLAI